MQDRPDAPELAQAVREFLEREILTTVADPRLRFRALVAANALGILERELTLGEAYLRSEAQSLGRLLGRGDPIPDGLAELRSHARQLNVELARRIRAGDPPEGTLDHLLSTVANKLRVASPRYLERFR
jgi:alkylation response protein AidB-like acyl-CoA dehydrogenase